MTPVKGIEVVPGGGIYGVVVFGMEVTDVTCVPVGGTDVLYVIGFPVVGMCVTGVPVGGMDVTGVPVGGTDVNCVPVGGMDVTGVPVGGMDVT